MTCLALADRAQIFDLYKDILSGKNRRCAGKNYITSFHHGADPAVIIQDMLEITHWLTRPKKSFQKQAMIWSHQKQNVKQGLENGKRAFGFPFLPAHGKCCLKVRKKYAFHQIQCQRQRWFIVRLTYSSNLPNAGRFD